MRVQECHTLQRPPHPCSPASLPRPFFPPHATLALHCHSDPHHTRTTLPSRHTDHTRAAPQAGARVCAQKVYVASISYPDYN